MDWLLVSQPRLDQAKGAYQGQTA